MTEDLSQGRAGSVVLFDFGGTLDSDGIAWKPRFCRLWHEEVGEIDAELFERAFHETDDALVGTVPPTTSLTGTARLLALGLVARLRPERREAAERMASRFCSEAARHLQGSAALLARLAAAHRLGIVSNFYGNLSTVCEEAGLTRHLSVAIDSAAVGFQKPDVRIFQAALSAVGSSPSEAVFVGDSRERDMAGARAAGIRHVLLAGAGDSESPESPLCCPGDRVIRRLSELPEALE